MSKRAIGLRYRYYQSRLYSSKDDEGYMVRRLQELKRQNTIDEDDPLFKVAHSTSVVSQNEKLQELYESLPQKSFNEKHRTQIQYSKLADYVNKQSKDIALSKPWRGQEDLQDASHRMIIDAVGKPINTSAAIQGNLAFTTVPNGLNESRAVRSSKKLMRKLENAQDNVLKYKSDIRQKEDDSEQSEFRVLYAEKFTPIGSFDKIRSVADRRIEESMKTGGFDNLHDLRGKSLPAQQHNPHVDRTEYHLNNMLARQKIVPPWIEVQGRVNSDINSFRAEVIHKFENDFIYHMKKHQIWRAGSNLESIKSSIIEHYGSMEELVQSRYQLWKSSQKAYFKVKIRQLNDGLRTYNSQAPLSTQKLYLLPEEEFQRISKSFNLQKLILRELQSENKQNVVQNVEKRPPKPFNVANFFKFW